MPNFEVFSVSIGQPSIQEYQRVLISESDYGNEKRRIKWLDALKVLQVPIGKMTDIEADYVRNFHRKRAQTGETFTYVIPMRKGTYDSVLCGIADGSRTDFPLKAQSYDSIDVYVNSTLMAVTSWRVGSFASNSYWETVNFYVAASPGDQVRIDINSGHYKMFARFGGSYPEQWTKELFRETQITIKELPFPEDSY